MTWSNAAVNVMEPDTAVYEEGKYMNFGALRWRFKFHDLSDLVRNRANESTSDDTSGRSITKNDARAWYTQNYQSSANCNHSKLHMW